MRHQKPVSGDHPLARSLDSLPIGTCGLEMMPCWVWSSSSSAWTVRKTWQAGLWWQLPHHRRMDQENVVSLHNGILCSHEEERNFIICR
jgi:hypothetical protein